MSGATQAVQNMFQPPELGGSFFARRVTTVFQSIACRSTLNPAWRKSCAATSGSFWIDARSVGFMSTTGVPSYPELFSSSCALRILDFDWMSLPFGLP